jgi:ADP-ribose pyrophosphatase YjhB (NUDIX family)
MEVMATGYFDMLATNVALGPFTPETAPLLRGRAGLAETQLSNMMALDLTLITSDGYVPVFFRSANMAALDRCWQTSSGESVQLQSDVDTDGQPDIFATARRGLHEELGIEPEELDEIALTAVVATPEFANVGLLMLAQLSSSTAEFASRFNRYVMTARDNWEYSAHTMLALDDAGELASALTDPLRRWTKQAAASLVFAHAFRANGDVRPLAKEICKRGRLSLEAGNARRDVLSTAASEFGAVAWHCWRCGSRLVHAPPARCEACGQEAYANPKPCGEAVVVRDRHVLLVERTRDPWRGHWDLPGGFCEGREHPSDAAQRELAEEVGLLGDPIDFIGIWMDDYARDATREATANVAYLFRLRDDRSPVVQPDEVADARWFPLEELPANLAFPGHVPLVLRRAAEMASGDAPSDEPPHGAA